MSLISSIFAGFRLEALPAACELWPRFNNTNGVRGEESKAKSSKAKVEQKNKDNRYVRAFRILVRNETTDVKTLADKAFLSERTASAALEGVARGDRGADRSRAVARSGEGPRRGRRRRRRLKPVEKPASETTVESPARPSSPAASTRRGPPTWGPPFFSGVRAPLGNAPQGGVLAERRRPAG
jgi:hypothetical protein